jgi:hypothetical protein
MPLSPHTPPGTHIVVTWVAETLDEYCYEVILPSYRATFYNICHTLGYRKPTLRLGQRFVLAEIVPCDGTKTGFMCTLVGGDVRGHALEHFDVAVLPKAITDLLTAPPGDIDTEVREAVDALSYCS